MLSFYPHVWLTLTARCCELGLRAACPERLPAHRRVGLGTGRHWRPVGALHELLDDDHAADEAVERVIRGGYFRRGKRMRFQLERVLDTLDDLRAWIAEFDERRNLLLWGGYEPGDAYWWAAGLSGFWQWYDTEQDYDGGNVKISTNGGATWTLLTPDIGYTGTGKPTNAGIPNEKCFSGHAHQAWEKATFNLTAYKGQTVMIRWHFGSDSSGRGDSARITWSFRWGSSPTSVRTPICRSVRI